MRASRTEYGIHGQATRMPRIGLLIVIIINMANIKSYVFRMDVGAKGQSLILLVSWHNSIGIKVHDGSDAVAVAHGFTPARRSCADTSTCKVEW